MRFAPISFGALPPFAFFHHRHRARSAFLTPSLQKSPPHVLATNKVSYPRHPARQHVETRITGTALLATAVSPPHHHRAHPQPESSPEGGGQCHPFGGFKEDLLPPPLNPPSGSALRMVPLQPRVPPSLFHICAQPFLLSILPLCDTATSLIGRSTRAVAVSFAWRLHSHVSLLPHLIHPPRDVQTPASEASARSLRSSSTRSRPPR